MIYLRRYPLDRANVDRGGVRPRRLAVEEAAEEGAIDDAEDATEALRGGVRCLLCTRVLMLMLLLLLLLRTLPLSLTEERGAEARDMLVRFCVLSWLLLFVRLGLLGAGCDKCSHNTSNSSRSMVPELSLSYRAKSLISCATYLRSTPRACTISIMAATSSWSSTPFLSRSNLLNSASSAAFFLAAGLALAIGDNFDLEGCLLGSSFSAALKRSVALAWLPLAKCCSACSFSIRILARRPCVGSLGTGRVGVVDRRLAGENLYGEGWPAGGGGGGG